MPSGAALQGIADALEGTSGNFDVGICQTHGIGVMELAVIAADHGLMRCRSCRYWVAVGETRGGKCGGCR